MTSSEPYRLPGLELIDHFFVAPLDHSKPEGRQLDIFFAKFVTSTPRVSRNSSSCSCKEVLSKNTVPVVCAVYANDMFVNAKFSKETVDFVPNMKAWYTSEYKHCGIRQGGEDMFSRLIDLASGEVER